MVISAVSTRWMTSLFNNSVILVSGLIYFASTSHAGIYRYGKRKVLAKYLQFSLCPRKFFYAERRSA
jgi:hypothetical protein